jgi:hypothetical protein
MRIADVEVKWTQFRPRYLIKMTDQPHTPAEQSFCPEDGGSMFLRNVGIYPQVYTALQPKRPTSTSPSPWERQSLILKNSFVTWWDFRFSRWRVWRWLSSGMLRRVAFWLFSDVSEEYWQKTTRRNNVEDYVIKTMLFYFFKNWQKRLSILIFLRNILKICSRKVSVIIMPWAPVCMREKM